jgi:hypothetical protein
VKGWGRRCRGSGHRTILTRGEHSTSNIVKSSRVDRRWGTIAEQERNLYGIYGDIRRNTPSALQKPARQKDPYTSADPCFRDDDDLSVPVPTFLTASSACFLMTSSSSLFR